MNPQPDPNSSLLKWSVIFFILSLWALSGIKAKAADAYGVHAKRAGLPPDHRHHPTRSDYTRG